eukprot:m.909370 g.909370  ORF g.909370 m.909370 type:complete len:552 (+) comp23720_c0_seq4:360-2015(+)
MGNICCKTKDKVETKEETFYPKVDENPEHAPTSTLEEEYKFDSTAEFNLRSNSEVGGDGDSDDSARKGELKDAAQDSASHPTSTIAALDKHFGSLGDTNGVPDDADEEGDDDGTDITHETKRLSSFRRVKGSLRLGEGEKAAKLRSEVDEDARRAQQTQEELARRREAFLAQQKQEAEAQAAAAQALRTAEDEEEADGEGFKGFEDEAHADELARAQEKLEAAKQKALQRASKYDKMVPVTNAEQKAKVIDEEEQFDYVPEGEVSDLMSMFMETEAKALEEKNAEAERLKPKRKRWEPKAPPVEVAPEPSAASLAVPDNLAPDSDEEENVRDAHNADATAGGEGDETAALDPASDDETPEDPEDTVTGTFGDGDNEHSAGATAEADGSEFVSSDFYSQDHNDDSDEEEEGETDATAQSPTDDAASTPEHSGQAVDGSSPGASDATQSEWLHGADVSTSDADMLLAADNGYDEDGRFLIREVDAELDKYIIDVVYKGLPTHHVLEKNDDGLFEVNRSPLEEDVQSLEEVVQYLRIARSRWPVPLTSHVPHAS